ncbi:hypothetical protein [Calycomorphotria hydatis]|uniref:SLA1 homology domain-containing protein n=1 Tax=Calycomorphotria hydatis TaxID=2528027 RepID=A0A517TD20_9PLAN|nr:hypothetical protein [Calycomorphotria hydatis]QDT66269.1 hypothetical protein V22_35340 [Calycomorphotria hydatis]
MFRLSFLLFAWLSLVSGSGIVVAEDYDLSWQPDDARWVSNDLSVQIEGSLKITNREGGNESLPLKLIAKYRFDERPLPGTGRDALAYRAQRVFRAAGSRVTVKEKVTTSILRARRGEIVAQLRSDGINPYALSGPLTPEEKELLKTPLDSIALPTLLPTHRVAIGDEWSPPEWAAQSLLGIEAFIKGKLRCRLEVVDGDLATVTFAGLIEGADDGARNSIEVSGEFQYQLKDQIITQARLVRKEQREVGPVAPGMTVTVSALLQRRFAEEQPGKATALEEIALNPQPSLLSMELAGPNKTALVCPPDWKLFHGTDQIVILRLVRDGDLLAQCNITVAPKVSPGEHTPDEEFVADVRSNLSDRLVSMDDIGVAERSDGMRILRILTTGKVDELDMEWRYYLLTAPDGRQLAILYSMKTPAAPSTVTGDELLLQSLRFE